MDKFRECIEAQHGDSSWIGRRPLTPDTCACMVYAEKDGYIDDIEPVELARTVMDMGGGCTEEKDCLWMSLRRGRRLP